MACYVRICLLSQIKNDKCVGLTQVVHTTIVTRGTPISINSSYFLGGHPASGIVSFDVRKQNICCPHINKRGLGSVVSHLSRVLAVSYREREKF